MTIDEAIKILKTTNNQNITPATQNFRDAIKLGIKALKRELQWRKDNSFTKSDLLPGETKD